MEQLLTVEEYKEKYIIVRSKNNEIIKNHKTPKPQNPVKERNYLFLVEIINNNITFS